MKPIIISINLRLDFNQATMEGTGVPHVGQPLTGQLVVGLCGLVNNVCNVPQKIFTIFQRISPILDFLIHRVFYTLQYGSGTATFIAHHQWKTSVRP